MKRLRAEFSGGQFVHAYLFSGPSGTGKRSGADICARALHCEAHEKPCDVCPSCSRMLSGSHPDHHILETSGRSIGVNEIRELVGRVSIKPFEGGRHTVIIDGAEKMTVQAQNALLKTLETPPSGTVFFLLAASPSQMLPTIVSRCRPMRFHTIGCDDARTALMELGIPSEKAALAAAASGGSVGKALVQLEEKNYWTLRERVIDSLNTLKRDNLVGEAALKLTAQKEDASDILDILEGFARDMIRVISGLSPEQPDFQRITLQGIHGEVLLSGVNLARKKLSANVSWQTVLEMMYFNSLRGSISWQQ